MMKIVILLVFSSVVQSHDPTKCEGQFPPEKYGLLDNYEGGEACCGLKDVATCSDNHVISWGVECDKSKETKYYHFYCLPLKGHEVMHDKIIEDHDNTKCRYDGPTPGNCCGNKITSHCAENYQTIWGAKCGFKNNLQHWHMWCVPVKEETRILAKENNNPTKCG